MLFEEVIIYDDNLELHKHRLSNSVCWIVTHAVDEHILKQKSLTQYKSKPNLSKFSYACS